MERHNEVSQQSSPDALSQPGLTQPRRLTFLIFITLAMVTLACAYFGPRFPSAAERIVHLPTLTRTPLPTLTPTVASPPQAVAMSPEPTVIPLPLIPSPISSAISVVAPPLGQVPVATDSSRINTPPAAADAVVISPTNPPTPPLTETPLPTSTPMATVPEPPTPTSTATEVSTPTPLPADWVFSGVWVFYDRDEGGLLLHGDVLNNTGASQELTAITGTFYDGQGQILLDGNTDGYWPIAAVSSGGRVPFELLAPGLQSAANFDLRVEAKPSNDPPRQDFEFLAVTPSTQDGNYCLTGKLRNTGGDLQSYLVIAAVLFDSQDNVLEYADYYEYYPKDLGSGRIRDFEICVDTLNQAVARYELRAWGL